MKGKSYFTRAEADAIIELIKAKLKADSEKQKSIRGKIRKLGFYASDFGLRDGYTVADFLGVAIIIGAGVKPSAESQIEKSKVIKPDKSKDKNRNPEAKATKVM
jgi:hypothetical protein